MADFSRFGAHICSREHFSIFDPESRTLAAPPPHMTENLVHPPVLQYRAISRNIRLFWHALGVICAWVPLGLAGGVVRGVNGGRRARSRPNLAKFQNLRTPSGVDEL